MDGQVVDKKYTDFIEGLIVQISPLLPPDVNELQKNYLITNIRKSATLMAESIIDNEEFNQIDFDKQCFYIQVLAEWSFHKEIDLFRSGIPARYWKGVMQKIWYTMWEVMFACVKNDAPESVVLSLVERFVNRIYKDAVEELKEQSVIDKETEEKAKEQSNIAIMAEEYRIERKVSEKVQGFVKRFLLAIILGTVVAFAIIKFKMIGLVAILTILLVYNIMPVKKDE